MKSNNFVYCALLLGVMISASQADFKRNRFIEGEESGKTYPVLQMRLEAAQVLVNKPNENINNWCNAFWSTNNNSYKKCFVTSKPQSIPYHPSECSHVLFAFDSANKNKGTYKMYCTSNKKEIESYKNAKPLEIEKNRQSIGTLEISPKY